MKNWDRCTGCMERWKQGSRYSALSRGLSERPFRVSSKTGIGLTKVHVDNKGIIDGLWKGEMNCIGPKANDADLRIEICEDLHTLRSQEILIEIQHVKTHRTQKEIQRMSFDEKADELAKEGAMMDAGFMAQA